jgi:hypothetical protein
MSEDRTEVTEGVKKCDFLLGGSVVDMNCTVL